MSSDLSAGSAVFPQPLTHAELSELATAIRCDIVRMLAKAGSGHSAGALGMTDIFTALYFGIARHNPSWPEWPDRDRIVLSNGHICPVLYACLAETGYFPLADLQTLRQFGSPLQGHPSRVDLPGVEVTAGPLGQGISQAVGMALAGQMDQKTFRVFCLTSDGEHNEGQTWEAVMLANKYQLSNLTVVIDRNNIQIDGFSDDVMPLGSLAEKYRAFGWNVIEIDGHVLEQIQNAFRAAAETTGSPTCIVARTIPGKGVSFMENKPEWHGKAPSAAEAEQALRELMGTEKGER